MIICLEGLPRSGKSYEAMVFHILAALRSMRKVYAYIEGLNHDKIAELAGIPVSTCQDLLTQITREQVPTIYDHVSNDALVVIDELQNFWPTDRAKCSPQITQFVAEHGHDGLDIIVMCQDLRDCHSLWKRRVQSKFSFTKLIAAGMENSYSWKAYEATSSEKFQKLSSGVRKYDPKFFGTYKSHTEGTNNTSNYQDSRLSIFNKPFFRYGIPLLICFIAYSVYNLYQSDQSDQPKPLEPISIKSMPNPYGVYPSNHPKYVPPSKSPIPRPSYKPASSPATSSDYLSLLLTKYKPRLSGFLTTSGTPLVFVEFYDSSHRTRENFNTEQLLSFGWKIELVPYGLILSKGSDKHVITSWPVKSFSLESETRIASNTN